MNNRGLRIDPGELNISMFPSQRKKFLLHEETLLQLSVFCC